MNTQAVHRHKRARFGARFVAAITAVALAVTGLIAAPAATAAPAPYGAPDEIAAKYYEALLRHTNWAESVWDEAKGVYRFNDFNFAVVMGNAVLLNHGEYDEALAGVSEADLRAKTIATIEYYASRNRNVNPTGTQDLWGKRMFWDTTFQSYFLMAGKLMWDELDAQTQQNLNTIAREQSRYTVGLNMADEPMSGDWTARWPEGGYSRDTALEEVGVYTQSIAPGVAWAKDDPENAAWEAQLNVWLRNAAGQPTADKANPAIVGGAPISDNKMQNIHDTYLVENHNSFGPHYQQDIWRSGARNAIHFLLNDLPVPEAMIKQPNSAELWRSIEMVMSDQGEPLMPMVSDREFLYGRNLLPLAFVGQVLRNPTAVRAEAQLADAFEAYQSYEPVYRLTKFNGEPKYEPEARAELGISYMLHVLAAESDEGPVEPADEATWLADVAGVRDFGANPGLVVQQTGEAWAASATRAGFVKFPWSPKHDSWLVAISGSSTSLYPRLNDTVTKRDVKVYNESSDGFEGTATTVTTNQGRVSMTTLPTGSAVYAATGQPATETSVTIRSLDMSGYNGLDGTRSYTGVEGTTVVDNGRVIPKDAADNSAWRSHDLEFDPVEARYVRMQGVRGNATYGYSMYKFHVYGAGTATDVAKGKPATASSAAPNNPASYVTNNTASQRWAVSTADRTRNDSWIQVDLGAPTMIDKARLAWETSAGEVYDLQVSNNGTDWTTVADYDVVDRNDEIALTPPGAEQPAPVTARYIRMMGERPHAQYGYSAFYFRALDANGNDLAAGKPATASSQDGSGFAPSNVTSSDPRSRWAVSKDDRGRTDSWIQIDLGEEQSIAKAVLGWEQSPKRYRIETSVDGTNWQTTGNYEYTGDRHAQTDGGWMNVEDKGGYVVRGSDDPITVTRFNPTQYRLNLTGDNGDETRVVEMVPGDATRTAAQAAVETPQSSDPSVVANYVDGYLVVNNLTDEDRDVKLTITNDDGATPLFEGTQTATRTATVLDVSAPAASTQVFAPRASVELTAGQTLNATLTDARSIQISSASGAFTAGIKNLETGVTTNVAAGDSLVPVAARFAAAHPYPIADFALGSLTFPASVLPTGMTSPHNAVDGDSATTWTPGPGGRMVVDLGAAKEIGQVIAAWDSQGAPASTIETSADGLTFTTLGALEPGADRAAVSGPVTARYVAIKTQWAAGDPVLASLQVLPVGGVDSEIAAHESGIEFNASGSTVTPGEDANLSVALPLDATGSVIFREGATVLATVPVKGGSASYNLTDLSLGEHEFTIEYTGDAHYRAATSEVIKINVTLRDAAIVLTADKSQVAEGEDVVLTAQVDPAATGTIEFFDGETSVGVKPVASGFASVTVPGLAKGKHAFTASYSGDGVFAPGDSLVLTVTAGTDVVEPPVKEPAVSAATLSAGRQVWQAKSGKRITVRAVVRNTTSGTVTFRSGKKLLGTAPVVKSGSQYVASVRLPAKFAVGKYAGVTATLTTQGKTYTTVNAAAKFAVVKTKPKKVTVRTKKYRASTTAKIKVKVGKLTNGKKAVGKVRVIVGKKKVRTVKLTKKKNGNITVKLPRRVTSSGKTLRVRAVFLPNPKQKAGVAKAKSKTVKVTARR